jgi:hypothetical protein
MAPLAFPFQPKAKNFVRVAVPFVFTVIDYDPWESNGSFLSVWSMRAWTHCVICTDGRITHGLDLRLRAAWLSVRELRPRDVQHTTVVRKLSHWQSDGGAVKWKQMFMLTSKFQGWSVKWLCKGTEWITKSDMVNKLRKCCLNNVHLAARWYPFFG